MESSLSAATDSPTFCAGDRLLVQHGLVVQSPGGRRVRGGVLLGVFPGWHGQLVEAIRELKAVENVNDLGVAASAAMIIGQQELVRHARPTKWSDVINNLAEFLLTNVVADVTPT